MSAIDSAVGTASRAFDGATVVDVFVSYSTRDKTIADAAVATLEQSGVRCWYAPRDVPAGKSYAEEIVEAVRSSRVMVVIVSENAVSSQQVVREVDRAIHYGLVLVPFRIQDIRLTGAFELFLSVPHWLDALTPPLEAHLDRLRDAVRAILGSEPMRVADVKKGPARRSRPNTAPVEEVSPDLWSTRPRSRFRQFLDRFLGDPEG